MKATITIEMDNAAFFDDDEAPRQGPGFARILRGLAAHAESNDTMSDYHKRLFDVNGNVVGKCEVE